MLRVVLVIFSFLLPFSSNAQWRSFNAGMTMEEVRALYPGLKQLGRENQVILAPYLYGDPAIIYQVEPGTRIQATLLFDADQLKELRYSAPGEDGKALYLLLKAHYGEPQHENSLSNNACHIHSADWDSKALTIRFRLHLSTGFQLSDCSVRGGEATVEFR